MSPQSRLSYLRKSRVSIEDLIMLKIAKNLRGTVVVVTLRGQAPQGFFCTTKEDYTRHLYDVATKYWKTFGPANMSGTTRQSVIDAFFSKTLGNSYQTMSGMAMSSQAVAANTRIADRRAATLRQPAAK
jgi:hypothetical protein